MMKEKSAVTNPAFFPDRKALHRWFVKNHASKNMLWVAIRKKGSTLKGISYMEALEEALCFGWIDGVIKSHSQDFFLLRFSPRKPKSIWSKLNRAKVEELIKSGKMTAAGLVKINAAKKNGQWEAAYSSKEPPALPADLKAALKKTPLAWKNFNQFAPSYKTMYIRWVIDAKTKETRAKHIKTVCSNSLKKIKPG